MKYLVSLLFLIFIIDCLECRGLTEEFSWTRINYQWPGNSQEIRTKRYHHYYHHKQPESSLSSSSSNSFLFPGNSNSGGLSSGTIDGPNSLGIDYQYEANLPMGVNRWENKLFITVPRRSFGVPSTLNYILMNSTQKHNVPLISYPNWSFNQPTSDANGLVSVYRTIADACDRLWLVDTGYIETPGNVTRYHQGKIVIIDLHTDQIIRQYNFKDSDVRPDSLLANIAVDVTPNNCEEAFAYVPDLGGYGLIVYSLLENDSWRVSHNYFYLESLHGEFFVGGQRFQWNDGVFSLALSDINADGYRNVYFHSMAGVHIFSISTRILKDRQLATRSYHGADFKVVANRGEGAQTSSSDLHKSSGVLFLALVNQNSVGCYNVNKEPRRENFNVIHKDSSKMIYPADIKIYKDDVIVLSNTMPVQLYSRLNYDEVNFRVWIANVYDVVKGTTCSSRIYRPTHGYH